MSAPSPRQRWLILGALLLGTVGAAVFVDDDPVASEPAERPARRQLAQAGEAAGPVAISSSAGQPAPTSENAEAGSGKEDDSEAAAPDTIDPFRTKTWHIAPPPPPPPAPRAPPLPFQFLGQLIEEGEVRVFVNHQGQHLIIKAGDVINGTYTVEEISAGKVVFVYQPLQERQVLAIGAA